MHTFGEISSKNIIFLTTKNWGCLDVHHFTILQKKKKQKYVTKNVTKNVQIGIFIYIAFQIKLNISKRSTAKFIH